MTSTIAPGSIVLVTGVNGYIASHVADQLLESGFNVRGTVRDVQKAAGLVERWETKFGRGRIELVIVKDITVPEAFDSAVEGVSGIAHVASNVSFDPDPNLVIPGAVSSLHSILDSAAKSSTVESFVYTSSAAALAPPMPGVARRITAATFNEEDIEKAWAPPPYGLERAMSVYAASKVEAERALFTYAEEKKPHFAVKSIVLGVNFGKVLDWSIPASSGDFVKELLLGKPERAKQLAYQWFVDVQDSARLHVAALTDLTVREERILAYSEHYTWNDVMMILRRIKPDHDWIDDFTDGNVRDLSVISNERGGDLLREMGRFGWTSLEESLRSNFEGL
ncbi:hypothetical protein BGZ61DRAFT_507595 [Ilyonectria robusta]|uniref:uncharacterized protein n=1 Tax=Ilyonectria robusta TaxID=1079257 RepID=UPI001E8E9C26|nr:uncharacterized protein BGZ61DRAFT_507595 [Ilyonectria robusta]KAH8684064.1 hypothetical protein BGZ61DRAFT_507595 [Ilyonectria robusta]